MAVRHFWVMVVVVVGTMQVRWQGGQGLVLVAVVVVGQQGWAQGRVTVSILMIMGQTTSVGATQAGQT